MDYVTATSLMIGLSAIYIIGMTAGLLAGYWLWYPRHHRLEIETPKPIQPRRCVRHWDEEGGTEWN